MFVLKGSRFGSREAQFQHDRSAQARIDSMVMHYESARIREIKPFNPNYISDFKGYMLGMTPAEIDSLHSFRNKGKFIQTVGEFQLITGVSDSLLATMAPYFKFPRKITFQSKTNRARPSKSKGLVRERLDLNLASANELMKIKGIGEVLSARIVKFRDALGGFLLAEQLYDVYGLDESVANRVMEHYAVLTKPRIKPIDINLASEQEIASVIYINRTLARRIVAYRISNGPIEDWDELTKIEDFPVDQIDRIKLYLTL